MLSFLLVIFVFGSFIINFLPITASHESLHPISKKANTLTIVTSISIVADFASKIGEGIFTVESIVTGNENPHIYEPSPLEIQMVAESDLFIRFGLEGLEPWVQSVVDVNLGIKVLELVNSSMIEFDSLINADNPHVWMNPNNVKTMASMIYQQVSLLDPENIATFNTNLNNYLSNLDSLLSRIEDAKVDMDGMKVVVHHPSFKYLFDLLGIIRVGAIEEREGSEPSPDHIQKIMSDIETENVSLIVNQPQLEEETVNQIARETGIKIVDLTPLLGVFGLNSYIAMIDYNLIALKNPFEPPKVNIDLPFWFLVSFGITIILSYVLFIIVVRYRHSRSLLV